MSETAIKPKNSYELYMLLSPEAVDGDILGTEENIGKILQKHSAQIERSEKFTKKDLAYKMQDFEYAYSANIYFFAPAESIEEIQKELNTSEIPFLRLMISRVSKKAKTPPTARRRKPKIEEKRIASAGEKEIEQPKDLDKKEKKEEKLKESVKVDDKDKVTLEDIDKRLEEIMEQL